MADKIMNMGTSLMKAAKPVAQRFWFYGRVELAPPKPSDIPVAIRTFSNMIASAKSGSWKNLTVKQAFLNFLVGLEISGWFYVGECIGKRHIIGYKLN